VVGNEIPAFAGMTVGSEFCHSCKCRSLLLEKLRLCPFKVYIKKSRADAPVCPAKKSIRMIEYD